MAMNQNEGNIGVINKLMYSSILIGMFLSFYAIYIEYNMTTDLNYTASCDLNEEISCSKVLGSEYGHILSALAIVQKNSILDRPNCEFGVIFYSAIFIFYHFSKNYPFLKLFLLLTATFGIILSGILAYIMVNILRYVCLICIGTYVANFFIFLAAVRYSYLHFPQKLHHN